MSFTAAMAQEAYRSEVARLLADVSYFPATTYMPRYREEMAVSDAHHLGLLNGWPGFEMPLHSSTDPREPEFAAHLREAYQIIAKVRREGSPAHLERCSSENPRPAKGAV